MNNGRQILGVLLVVGFALVLTSCYREIYVPRPGTIDIAEEPTKMDRPERLQPKSPTLELVYSLRPVLELGGGRRDFSGHRLLQVGAEAYLIGGVHEREEDFIGPVGYSFWGLLAGGTIYSSHEDIGPRLYLEANYRRPFGGSLSAGWSVQPAQGFHGPQVTLGFFELGYVRWNYEIRQGWSAVFGFTLPLSHVTYRRVL